MAQDGGGLITLAEPRPGETRRQNEYVETPLQPRPAKPQPPPITAQPDKAAAHASDASSIICRQCRRCRCEACRGPRALPSKWLCDDKCLCSAPAAVDYGSCMCCVRGLFYHWAKDYEMDSDVSCADQPCSCAPHQRALRWCCLGLLAFPLPCLCCYWPLRGCLALAQAAYSRCTGRGCRCRTQPPLLDSE